MLRASTASFDCLVIGGSSGSVELLLRLLPQLPVEFPCAVLICIHAAPNTTAGLVELLASRTGLPVFEAEDKQAIVPGQILLAPGGYHLLVERDHSLSLSLDPPVKHARPAIDVLFESAADCYRERLLALILTGASADGTAGCIGVQQRGGRVLVQEPGSAQAATMPQSVLDHLQPEAVLPVEEIPATLIRLCCSAPLKKSRP